MRRIGGSCRDSRRLGEMSHMKFFDLDETATMRDLDNAPETYHKQTIQSLQLRRLLVSVSRYRKLAKKMHPDKNGGTDEAKQRLRSRVLTMQCVCV